MIPVEVVYGLPHTQRLLALEVPTGTTALEAVQLSGIMLEFPEIELVTVSLGIFFASARWQGLAGRRRLSCAAA